VAQVHIWRFHLYREQGRWHEAARAWEMAVEEDPDYAYSAEMVVQMFMQAGLTKEAEEYLDEAVLGTALMAYYRGLIAQQRGDSVRARHLWRETIAATEEDEEESDPALRGMARCLLGEPRLALAELLEDYQVSRTYRLRTALVLALAWAMEGDLQAARTNLDLAKASATGTLYRPGLLDAFDWRNFEALVTDAAIKEALRPYFEAAPPAP
jgi:tetratricopeptide (TPR) repeat protein